MSICGKAGTSVREGTYEMGIAVERIPGTRMRSAGTAIEYGRWSASLTSHITGGFSGYRRRASSYLNVSGLRCGVKADTATVTGTVQTAGTADVRSTFLPAVA